MLTFNKTIHADGIDYILLNSVVHYSSYNSDYKIINESIVLNEGFSAESENDSKVKHYSNGAGFKISKYKVDNDRLWITYKEKIVSHVIESDVQFHYLLNLLPKILD